METPAASNGSPNHLTGARNSPQLNERATHALQAARTGDVLLMNRNCWGMHYPLAIGICLLTKTENRFDHAGMLVKIPEHELGRFPEARKRIVETSPSGTYVLETNMRGITLFSAENRLARSSANEVAARKVILHEKDTNGAPVSSTPPARTTADKLNHDMLHILEGMYDAPYQQDVLAILPSVFSPPDKIDRVDAAYKINQLRLEVRAIDELLGVSKSTSGAAAFDAVPQAERYTALRAVYEEAVEALLDTYFPHLDRVSPTEAVWDRRHYIIDGANYSPRMVCTELIGNLWLRAGITNGYAPASSLRPFDFLDDTRFNFTDSDIELGSLVPIKTKNQNRRHWTRCACEGTSDTPAVTTVDTSPAAATGAGRLRFDNPILRDTGNNTAIRSIAEIPVTGGRAVLPDAWMVQSSGQESVRYLGARLFGTGVVFAFWAVPCAPLTLRWIEGQVGLFLVRGSVWSLACGLFARNVAFAAVQGLLASVLGHMIAPPHRSTLMDVMRSDTPSPASGSGALVDWRHPYYAVVGIFAASSLVAHIVTQPLVNTVLAHHFGPLRAGPLPRKVLMKGAYCLAPFSLLLPMQGYFLGWYETAGSFIIPTRSSVLRPRPDLLERADWPHYRNDALVGAFGAMIVADLLMYPFQTGVTRSFVRDVYAPQASPSIGRRPFPAYRYRIANNLIVAGATATSLSLLFNLM